MIPDGLETPETPDELISGAPEFDPQLPTQYRAQEMSNWCWAACLQMVYQIVSTSKPKQCDFANQALGRDNCCRNPAVCNEGYSDLCRILKESNIKNCKYVGAAVEFADVVQQIDSFGPVIYDLEFDDFDTTHSGVIVGYNSNAQGDWVYMLDPDSAFFDKLRTSPFGWYKYDWVKSAYGLKNSAWAGTWYGLGPTE